MNNPQPNTTVPKDQPADDKIASSEAGGRSIDPNTTVPKDGATSIDTTVPKDDTEA